MCVHAQTQSTCMCVSEMCLWQLVIALVRDSEQGKEVRHEPGKRIRHQPAVLMYMDMQHLIHSHVYLYVVYLDIPLLR